MRLQSLFIVGILMISTISVKAQKGFDVPHNLFSIKGGYALTGFGKTNFSPWGKDYKSKLKGGPTFDANYSHLWVGESKQGGTGIGLLYSIVNTSANYSLNNLSVAVEDKIVLHYIAPQYVVVRKLGNRLLSSMSYGVGYMYYHNNGEKDGKSCVTNSSGLGFNVDFNLNYYVTPCFSVGVDVDVTCGVFNKLHRTFEGTKKSIDLNDDYKFNPSRADFMLGLHYYF